MTAAERLEPSSDGPVDEVPGLTTTARKLAHHAELVEQSQAPGSARAIQKQRELGKLTARERIDLLLDPESFVEIDALVRHQSTAFGLADNRPLGDGVVAGHGTVQGRPVVVYSQDFAVFGGALGQAQAEKIMKLQDMAVKVGCPFIGINDSGGARIQEGVTSLAFYAQMGRRHARMSGVVPQICMVLGPCAGGAAYGTAMMDFTVMTEKNSYMFVTGPEVVYAVTGERTTFDELGGAKVSAEVSGTTNYVASDEPEAFEWVRNLLSYLPSNNLDQDHPYESENSLDLTELDLSLDTLIPDNINAAYDMKKAIHAIADDQEFLEVSEDFARNMICGYIRVEGRTVGVVANQPTHWAGVVDIDASEKAARFVRFCDAFNIPILTLVDVPGYLPGLEQERAGIIRRGAKMVYAYCEASVPMVTVVLRKAYGGGYAVMGSKHLGADLNFAWPTAEIAVMGAEGAVSVMYRKELLAAQENGNVAEVRAKLMAEYRDTLATPYMAAERGYVDAVIRPAETRGQVTRALRTLRTKVETMPARKHGNISL